MTNEVEGTHRQGHESGNHDEQLKDLGVNGGSDTAKEDIDEHDRG
jgi:hypothetical protein